MSYYGGGGSYSSYPESSYSSYGRGGGGGGGSGYYYGYGGGGASSASTGEAFHNPDYYDRESESYVKRRKMGQDVSICVDYIRGFCPKGSRCPKPHVDYVESMVDREILSKVKFCHDFQNRGVCGRRQECRFLHVTRREEDEFLLTGTIPSSVFTRMREWNVEKSMFNSFGDGPPSGDRGGGYGGGGFAGRKRSYPGDSMSPRGPPRGGFGQRGFRGRGRGGGGAGTEGHTSSRPVTFENYCIDYLKGTCVKGDQCYLKHMETIDNPDDRQGIVKQVFCHDFQNDRCKRPFCKYVHASREEESFFLENGYFPPSMNARNREKLFFSDVCLDFLRNQCNRGATCQFKHVQKVEVHSERICLSRSIFCHDYQEGECLRPNCKMVHTSAQDEQYFHETGMLPAHLKGGGDGGGSAAPSGRGGGDMGHMAAASATLASLEKKNEELETENEALKSRNQQLERLLADACYCMSLAVGDQNPAISQLMKTITEMAPESALAQQTGEGGAMTAAGASTSEDQQLQGGGPLSIAISS